MGLSRSWGKLESYFRLPLPQFQETRSGLIMMAARRHHGQIGVSKRRIGFCLQGLPEESNRLIALTLYWRGGLTGRP